MRIQEYVFSGCTFPPDGTEIKIRSSDQDVSLSAVKNTVVDLVLCDTSKCVPIAIFGDGDTSKALGCHWFWQMSSH